MLPLNTDTNDAQSEIAMKRCYLGDKTEKMEVLKDQKQIKEKQNEIKQKIITPLCKLRIA